MKVNWCPSSISNPLMILFKVDYIKYFKCDKYVNQMTYPIPKILKNKLVESLEFHVSPLDILYLMIIL